MRSRQEALERRKNFVIRTINLNFVPTSDEMPDRWRLAEKVKRVYELLEEDSNEYYKAKAEILEILGKNGLEQLSRGLYEDGSKEDSLVAKDMFVYLVKDLNRREQEAGLR